MFTAGNLLYIAPFVFENGAPPKPKYFVVLAIQGEGVIIASLPTSKDHIPADIEKTHGCINHPQRCVSCYYLEPNRPICENGFFFPLETYLYGEGVSERPKFDLEQMQLQSTVSVCGRLNQDEYESILGCFRTSTRVKNKSLFKNIIYNHFSISDIKAKYIIFSEHTTFRS